MIILSSRKLEQALANDSLSGWTKVKYIILPALIVSLFPPPYIFRPIHGQHPPMLNALIGLFFVIINIVVTYKGIKKCFEIHQKTDAQNFFERFFILSIPVFIKFMLIFLILSIGLVVGMHSMKESFPVLYKRYPILFSISLPFITWLYYHLLSGSIRRLGALMHTKNRKPS